MILGVNKMPIQWEIAHPYVREKYLEKFHEYRNYSSGSSSLHNKRMNIDEALKFIKSVNYKTCKK